MLRITARYSRRRFLVSTALVGCAFIAACGGAAEQTSSPSSNSPATLTPDPDETPKPTADPRPTRTLAPGEVRLEVDTASEPTFFRYVQTALEAPAGSKIMLTLNNKTAAKDEIGHNWVLVKPGEEESVLANAIKAGDGKDWLNVKDPGIIAHTRLIEGDDSISVTFKAPPAGTYTYLCTFPDHHAGGEKGTLTIK